MVYLLLSGDELYVKIGASKDPQRRVRALRCAVPTGVRLIGLMAGGKEQESAVQGMAAEHHIKGEWFHAACLETVRKLFVDPDEMGVSVAEEDGRSKRKRQPLRLLSEDELDGEVKRQDGTGGPLLSTAEFAQRVGVSRRTVYRWMEKGYLRPLRWGGEWRLRESDMQRMQGERGKIRGSASG